MQEFVDSFNEIQKIHHERMKEKGFWDKPRNNGELIALMHSELSEALEGLRNYPDSSTGLLVVEQELADAVLRIMDFAEARKLDVANRLTVKMMLNRDRPRKHGKAF